MKDSVGHVLYPLFGVDIQHIDWLVDFAFKTRGSKLTGYQLQMLLLENYTERYAMMDSARLSSPLGVYSVNNKEGLRELWPLSRRLSDYRLYKVGKEWGITLTEFLSLPREQTTYILDTLKKELENATAAAAGTKNKMKEKYDNEDIKLPL